MDLVAKKSFRIGNRGRVTKGERFSVDPVVGRVYVAIGHAEHPPRVLAPTPPPTPVAAPVYQTRVMTADVEQPAPRRRGRPRKTVATTEE